MKKLLVWGTGNHAARFMENQHDGNITGFIETNKSKDSYMGKPLPVGKERVEFNAHRVFYAGTVAECFSSLHLEEFSCAADGMVEYNADIHRYDNDSHNGEYRYGLFRFVK